VAAWVPCRSVRARWSSPVRYVECDQQGVVFNSHYLTWADEASTAWWAAHGLPWAELIAGGAEPVVKASTLEWTSSARFGDVVTVDAETEKVGRTSATLRFTVRVEDRVCCVVRNTYVWLADGAATPWPDDVRARLAADL
jgi:acyl-CoA thioester hydrolase